MWTAFLRRLTARGRLKWAELKIDGSFVPSKKGAQKPANAAAGGGTKLMLVAGEGGLPVHAALYPSQRNEGAIAAEVMAGVPAPPREPNAKLVPLLADKMYDGDNWRDDLLGLGYDLVCPHRKNRVRPKRQDGRKLRRYKRRWKIERTFAWIKAERRLCLRHERKPELFLGLVQLTCALVCLRHF